MTSAGSSGTDGNPAGSRNAPAGNRDGSGNPAGGNPGAATMADAGPSGERQVPFFCPYCGEEELRPAGSQGGGWDCLTCRRSFRLAFAGLVS